MHYHVQNNDKINLIELEIRRGSMVKGGWTTFYLHTVFPLFLFDDICFWPINHKNDDKP